MAADGTTLHPRNVPGGQMFGEGQKSRGATISTFAGRTDNQGVIFQEENIPVQMFGVRYPMWGKEVQGRIL